MNDLQQRVESLMFYGCGDEAYEVFSQTLELCYKMYGEGFEEYAEILYIWAKSMAEHSKEWTLNEYGDLEEVDSQQGQWG